MKKRITVFLFCVVMLITCTAVVLAESSAGLEEDEIALEEETDCEVEMIDNSDEDITEISESDLDKTEDREVTELTDDADEKEELDVDFQADTEEEETFAEEEAVFYASRASSKIPVDWVGANYKMDTDYAFTYAFRKGVTTLSSISRYNSSLNNKIHNWFGDSVGYTAEYCKTFYACAIDADKYTDPITVIYSNVGEYKGQIVDLRVTVAQWGAVNTKHVGEDGTAITPCVLFYKDRIAFNTISVGTVRFKFEFLKHNTQEQIYPKGHVTAADLDGGQGLRIYDGWGVDHIYLRKGYSYLSVTTAETANGSVYREITSSEGSASLSNNDVQGWCQIDFNGSFMLNWLAQDSWKNSTSAQNAFYISTGQSVGSYEPNPAPEKRVGDEGAEYTSMTKHDGRASDQPYEISAGKNFDYIIAQRVLPGTYSSFVVRDELDSCLTYRGASVMTSLGNDVTSRFHIQVSGNVVTISAMSDFLKSDEAYNDVTYYFRIQVTAKTNAVIGAHEHYNKSDTVYMISNSASRTIISDKMQDTQETNESWVQGEITGQYSIRKIDSEDSSKLLSGAEFELFEWNSSSGQYLSMNRLLEYKEETGRYDTGILQRSISNEGRFRIVETKAPEGYEGNWAVNLDITKDGSSEKILDAENQRKISVNGEISVVKKIKQQDIVWAHGNPIFRFRITGTDMQGISHVYEDYVEFTEDNYTLEGDYAVLSCIFKGIPEGTYTISEMQTLRYCFESISADTSNVLITGQTGLATIDRNNLSAGVTFVNEKTRYDHYSHTDVIKNIIPIES